MNYVKLAAVPDKEWFVAETLVSLSELSGSALQQQLQLRGHVEPTEHECQNEGTSYFSSFSPRDPVLPVCQPEPMEQS